MGIIQIAEATRTGMRFIISLYGLSETGKTLSGLRLAAGLELDPKKRGLLDTEGGQRGRAYADHIAGGYLYGALSSPFTPERYIEAIDDFEAAGVNVLVIDSVSHAWFAEGGVLDMVEVANEKNDMAKWAKPKRRLSKMTRRILSSDMHIILCSRAKQPMVEEVVDGKKKYVPGPVVPIQEKSLRFDMTIMAHMLGDGRFTVKAPEGKCPGALRPIFAGGEVMDETMGKKLADWIKGDDIKTPAQRELEIRATRAAEKGTDEFRAFWKSLNPAQRAYLKPNLGNYESIAKGEADDDPFAKTETETHHAEPGKPFAIETLVERTIEAGEAVLADDTAREANPRVEAALANGQIAGDYAADNAGAEDQDFASAEAMAGRFVEGLAEMPTAEDIAELKERAAAAIKDTDITEDQKSVLLGRFNAAFLERKKAFGKQGAKAGAR